MANYVYVNLGASSLPSLKMVAVNKGDANLYLRVSGEYTLTPNSKVKAIIVPSGITVLPDPVEAYSVSALLTRLRGDKFYHDISYGIFSVLGGENDTDSDVNLKFNDVKINDYYWENKIFNVHWILQRDTEEIYGSYSGVYTFPHNIQNKEVIISGYLSSNNSMRYNVKWDTLYNEGDAAYGVYPNDGPYRFKINYAHDSGVLIPSLSDWIYYGSGTMSSGITFNVNYYDTRTQYNTPAIYDLYISNVSASSNKPGSNDRIIRLDHQKFIDSDNYFRNLDNQVFSSPDVNKLKKVGEVEIEPNIINRKRLSIGINDIAIRDNIYVKQGVYVSNYYPVDFNLYSISIKSEEFIPEYVDINRYDVVKYFIEINSKWERISPINRIDEKSDGNIVPKILIFDKLQNDVSYIKYIEINNVKIFRVKIVFDLSKIKEDRFIPPEIYNYKCIIFDKDQLNEL
jgi:hypothetical protein